LNQHFALEHNKSNKFEKEIRMDKKQMKIAGIVCLVVCAVCIFVAIERYNANASSVRAINSLQRNSPLGGMTQGLELKPGMPAATKYAIFFALLSGVGGGVLLYMANQPDSPGVPSAETPTEDEE
jgi:hypothetical protein